MCLFVFPRKTSNNIVLTLYKKRLENDALQKFSNEFARVEKQARALLVGMCSSLRMDTDAKLYT